MAAGRTIACSLKLLLILATVLPVFRDNALTRKEEVSTALMKGSTLPSVRGVARLACNPTVYPICRFKYCGKRFLSSRMRYTAKGTSSFNLDRHLLSCGDIATNPGPKGTKSSPKYPCGESTRTPFCASTVTNGRTPNVFKCPVLSFNTT